MSGKKLLLISFGIMAVGTAAYFLFIRQRSAITDDERETLKEIEPVLSEE